MDRERRYWSRLYGEQNIRTAARTVFIAALAGPHSVADGTALLHRTGLPEAAEASAQKLLDAHARCYPPSVPDLVLEPLYPDRLAEDFIALTLPGPAPTGHDDAWCANLITTVQRADDGQIRHQPGSLFARVRTRPPAYTSRALIFLAAAAARHPHVEERLRTLLHADPALAVDAGGAALQAVTPHTDVTLAEKISDHLPDYSVDLNPAAAALTERLLTLAAPTARPEHRAHLQDNLAVRLINAGRREEALTLSQEATNLYRQLAHADPDAHLPDLATSLDNLGNVLAELGRPEEALTPTQEATNLYRQLARANPDAHLPDLATSLGAYARVRVLANRDLSGALAAIGEAIALYTRLAEQDPTTFSDRRIAAYHILGFVVDALDHPDEAAESRRRLDTHGDNSEDSDRV